MNASFFNVTKIEIVNTFLQNNGQRTMRVTWRNPEGSECKAEFVCYGNTSALEGLPRSGDFHVFSFDTLEAAE